MKESDYYPAGAYNDPRAPYNEPVIPEQTFDTQVYQTLAKTVTITTDNYVPEYEEESGSFYPNTENTDWKEEYENNEHYTPLQLINLFKRYLESELNHREDFAKHPSVLQSLIDECSDWEEEDYNVEEN